MASFDAGNVVEPLAYDFSAMANPPPDGCGIKGLADVKGVIREPTDAQIMTFGKAMIAYEQRLAQMNRRPARPPDDATDEQYEQYYEKFLEAQAAFSEAADEAGLPKLQAEIFSALCSGKPTVAQILLLPRRIRNPFYEWLRKEVLNPEAAAGDGSDQGPTLLSAVAG